MAEIQKAKQVQKLREFFEEHKIQLREADRLKQEAMAKMEAQKLEKQRLEEEERQRHAPKIKIIGNYDQVEVPAFKQSTKIVNTQKVNKMQYTAREEHVVFFAKPKQLI